MLLLSPLLLFHAIAVAVAVAAVVAAVVVADEDSTRRTPNRTDFGPTWDRTGSRRQEPPMWQMIPGRRPG